MQAAMVAQLGLLPDAKAPKAHDQVAIDRAAAKRLRKAEAVKQQTLRSQKREAN
jgi:hypothetical protein